MPFAEHQDAIRVLIIDSGDPFPSALFPKWRESCAVHLAAHASDRRSGLGLCKSIQPDVIGVECQMLGERPPYLSDQLWECAPRAKLLAILRPPIIQRQISVALERGADGFILASAASAEWLTAANAVHAKGFYLPAALERAIRQTVGRDARWSQKLLFSNREREVLGAVTSGASSKEIAAALGLSIHTVVNHRRRIKLRLAHHMANIRRKVSSPADPLPSQRPKANPANRPASVAN